MCNCTFLFSGTFFGYDFVGNYSIKVINCLWCVLYGDVLHLVCEWIQLQLCFNVFTNRLQKLGLTYQKLPSVVILPVVYSARYARALCLSQVRSSTEMARCRNMQMTPHDSPGILAVWCQISEWNSNGVTPSGVPNTGWVGKNWQILTN